MFQLQGINCPLAIMTMPTMVNSDSVMEYLKVLATFGISMKKLEIVTSLDVAPQDMSMESMWHMRACEMCRDMPPKKTTNMRHHLKFSRTGWTDMSVSG